MGGTHGGGQGRAPGTGDRSRRQSHVLVGVVGRVQLQVGLVDHPGVVAGQQGSVGHGGVGGEGHAAGQPVVIHAGHHRPLLGHAGFLFHDRSHGHHLVDVGGQAQLGGVLAEVMDHGGGDVVQALGAGETVGVGEEVALEAGGLGIEVGDQAGVGVRDADEVVGAAQSGLLQHAGHFVEVVSLGHHHGVDQHVAAGDAVIDLDRVGGLVEAVFARLERLLAPVVHQQKAGHAADDAGRAQLHRDVTGGRAGAQHHGGRGRRLQRQEENVAQPGDGDRQTQQHQDEQAATQAISLDEKTAGGVRERRGERHGSPGTIAG